MISRRTSGLGGLTLALLMTAALAHAAPGYGKLSGIVVDPSGTPQMGATVWVLSEGASRSTPLQFLTNQRGLFAGEHLLPGLYSVRVTLAGFLPTVERHVRVSANLTTLLKIELDSVFTSLDRLRRRPEQQADADEWKWVLRTSAATRPVLQWQEGEVATAADHASIEAARNRRPRARVEVTSGAGQPGSVFSFADSTATAISFDQRIGRSSRLLLAGQMNYERSTGAAFATVWLPSGDLGSGSETTLLLRQAKLGSAGLTFRGLRMQHTNRLALGDRITLRYAAEYILVGLGAATSSLRPSGEVDVRLSPNWRASFVMAARPWSSDELPLQSALSELNDMPTVLWRNGRPVLEGGWHEEVGFERQVGPHASLEAATFRDAARHVAVFGRGAVPHPDFLQDLFSRGFVHDGGASTSWGTRVAYRQKFSDDFELAAVYAWAGALATEEQAADVDFRDTLRTRYRHSLAARVSGRLPKAGTRLAASYKWMNGPAVARQDRFGEALYQLEPNLSLSVRQPLPSFRTSGRWEALADFRNLLAEGYMPVNSREGRIVLVPAFRSFRGGVSFQF